MHAQLMTLRLSHGGMALGNVYLVWLVGSHSVKTLRISLLPNKETLCKNVHECSSYYLFPEVHNVSSSFILGKHCANSPNRSCPLRVILNSLQIEAVIVHTAIIQKAKYLFDVLDLIPMISKNLTAEFSY